MLRCTGYDLGAGQGAVWWESDSEKGCHSLFWRTLGSALLFGHLCARGEQQKAKGIEDRWQRKASFQTDQSLLCLLHFAKCHFIKYFSALFTFIFESFVFLLEPPLSLSLEFRSGEDRRHTLEQTTGAVAHINCPRRQTATVLASRFRGEG